MSDHLRSRLVILMYLAITASCGQDVEVWIEEDSFGKVAKEYEFYNHPDHNKRTKHGYYNEYYPNGSYKSVGLFEDDKRHGKWTEYNPDESIFSEGIYKNGKEWEGTFLQIDSIIGSVVIPEDKQFKIKARFQNGQKNGKWTLYKDKEDSGVFIEFHYQVGALTGEYAKYISSGKIWEKGKLKNGDRDGFWMFDFVTETNNGAIIKTRQGQYANGKKNGYWEEVIREESIELREWIDIIGKGVYRDDHKTGVWIYSFNTGTKHSEGNYKTGKKSGKWTFYSSNGRKRQEGQFIDGIKEGEWIHYSYAGGPPAIHTFKLGEHINSMYYTPDGSLVSLQELLRLSKGLGSPPDKSR